MRYLKRSILALFVMVLMVTVVAGCGLTQVSSPQPVQQIVTLDSQESANFVTVAWLKGNLDKVIVLDARTDKEYQGGHIPGAINATWQPFTNMNGKPGDAGWGTLLPKGQLAAKLGAIGIDGKKLVVSYTNPGGWGEDGRLTWMLRTAGIKDTKMLDGGWKAWSGAKYQVSQDKPVVKPVTMTIASMDEGFNATTDWIKNNAKSIKIVDARSPKEYNGATDYGEARGGHLPEAISVPFLNCFKADGTIKSTADLTAMFTKAGLKPDDVIVTYCTKGIRSAHMALMLRMCGFDKARNYDASFYEWSGNPALLLAK